MTSSTSSLRAPWIDRVEKMAVVINDCNDYRGHCVLNLFTYRIRDPVMIKE